MIYRVKNKINGKSYIGQTTMSLERRIKGHLKDAVKGSILYFHRSLKKYGIENFDMFTLCVCDSKKELNEKEIYYIKKYKTFNKVFGYNLTLGGGGTRGCDVARKSTLQYDLNGNFIKEWKSIKFAAESLNLCGGNISNCCNGKRFKQVGGFVWRHKSENFNKKIDVYVHYRELNTPIPVLRYDLSGNFIQEYTSVTSASKNTGLSATLIINNCSGITRLPNKFIWRYKNDPLIVVPKYIKRIPSIDNIKKLKAVVSKPTLQYDLNGNFIKEFVSAKEAAIGVGVHYDSIYKACRGQLKTVAGFVWKYKENNYESRF